MGLLEQLSQIAVPATTAQPPRNTLPVPRQQSLRHASEAQRGPELMSHGDALNREIFGPTEIAEMPLSPGDVRGLLKLGGFKMQKGIDGFSPDSFSLTGESGEVVRGHLRNADFPGAKSDPSRGEIFYVEVPTANQKRGLGTAAVKEALERMREAGAKTVNTHPVTEAGRKLDDRLIREGLIEGPVRVSESGKAEYRIAGMGGSLPEGQIDEILQGGRKTADDFMEPAAIGHPDPEVVAYYREIAEKEARLHNFTLSNGENPFRAPMEGGDNFIIVSREPTDATKWRATIFRGGTPRSHMETNNFAEAVEIADQQGADLSKAGS